jgi:hypothetical protein
VSTVISCHVRYEIAPTQIEAFERYERTILRTVLP